MFEKFNRHVFHRTMQNVKSHIGNGYHAMKQIAHNIDHGVHVAKQIYSVVEPVIRHVVGNNMHHQAMKAISGYESLRNKVAEADHHVSSVGHKLKGLV